MTKSSRATRTWTVAALAVAGGVTMASCLLPSVEVSERPVTSDGGAGGSGAGGSGGVGASGGAGGAGGSSECVNTVWPGPPAASDPSSEDVEFVVAMRKIDLGENAPDIESVGPTIGYDLDLRCTGYGDGSSCLVPSGAMPSSYKDGPGGIDNRAAKLFASAKDFSTTIGSDRYTKGAESGKWSLLVRVRGYNGTPNDSNVHVAIYPSPGIHGQACVDSAAVPAWDGSDAWPIESSSLQAGKGFGSDGGIGPCGKGVPNFTFDSPKFFDANAYVTDGVLVANIPQSQLVLTSGTNGTLVKLTAGFITGKIVKDGGGIISLKSGVLTGRWKATDLFAALSHVVNDAQAICTDNQIYQVLKYAVCKGRDIAASLGGPTTPCDAVSIAIGFEAGPAKLGIVAASLPLLVQCPKATDPAFDTCPD